MPVTVGFEDKPVADFENAAQWSFAAARATGSLSAAPGQSGGGLKLSYDFTQSTATRAAYASPPQQIEVAGQPQAFGLWINSTGKGEWPSLEFYDGQGQSQILRGPYMTWTGWKYVEFAVPPGVSYPLKLRRFYVAETKTDAKYTNDILIDGLVAKVPPSVTAPPAQKVADPVVKPDGGQDAVAVRRHVGRPVRRPRPGQRHRAQRPPYAPGDQGRQARLPADQR